MNKFIILLFIVIISACNNNYTPKPMGYMRIALPNKEYLGYKGNLPYSFEYAVYSIVKTDTMNGAEKYWINIEYPQYNGKMHISYKTINKNLAQYIEDSRKLAYKHAVKADAIDEQIISFPEKNVYGLLYDIKGNTASAVQFFLTDSSNNFLRGALYISARPNQDSLAPILVFLRKDVDRFIESFSWK